MKGKAKKEGDRVTLGVLCFSCRTWKLVRFDLPPAIAFFLRFLGSGEWELELHGFYECNDCHEIGGNNENQGETVSLPKLIANEEPEREVHNAMENGKKAEPPSG